MRELTLIRHGITTWNQGRVLQGHQDVPLSEQGRWQSRQLAKRLALEPLPDALYSSDLARARETAEHIIAVRPFLLRTTPALRERSFGQYEGRVWDEVQALMEQGLLETGVAPDDFTPPGGESRRQVQKRVLEFIADLERAHPGGRVWVVSHGGIIRFLVHHLLDATIDAFSSGYHVTNAGVTTLERTPAGWKPVRLNCVIHLTGRREEEVAESSDESVVEGPTSRSS